MDFTLLNNSTIASQDERGVWFYKANPDYKPFKKDNTLRQHYKDMPRFKCIIEAEASLMQNYDNSLKESVKEMSSILHSLGH